MRNQIAVIILCHDFPTLSEVELFLSAVRSESFISVCIFIFVPKVGEAIVFVVVTSASNNSCKAIKVGQFPSFF